MGIPLKQEVKDAEAWKGGAILPPGFHTVTIDTAEDTKTKDGSKDQVALEMSSQQGSIRDWLTFTDAAAGRIKMFTDACGIDLSGLDEFPTGQLPGKQVRIFVKEEPRQDDPSKTRSTVVSYEKATGSHSDLPAPSDDSDLPF